MRQTVLAMLGGAFVGWFAVVLTGIAIDTEFIPLTLPAGVAGGAALALFALHVRANSFVRFFWMVLLALLVVSLAEAAWLALLGLPGLALFGAALTTAASIPGVLLGALVLGALIRPDGAERARAAELRWHFTRAFSTAEPAALLALQDPSEQVREVAIRWIAAQHPDPVSHLRAHVDRLPRDQACVARALDVLVERGPARTPGAESLLLDILECGDHHARRAAIRSLGSIGGRRALAALQRLLDVDSFAIESRAAMRRIRARLPHAEPGTLSVSEDSHGGTLSDPADGGALSEP